MGKLNISDDLKDDLWICVCVLYYVAVMLLIAFGLPYLLWG